MIRDENTRKTVTSHKAVAHVFCKQKLQNGTWNGLCEGEGCCSMTRVSIKDICAMSPSPSIKMGTQVIPDGHITGYIQLNMHKPPQKVSLHKVKIS